MASDKLHWLPVIVFVLFPGTFIITYIIAVCLDHVEPAFPYISDVGTEAPESCIFGQLINLGCILLVLSIYIRYRQLRTFDSFQRLNWVSLWLGCIAALGLSIVGNFQESRVIIVHMIGAFLCFGLGTVYFWLQVVVSFRMSPADCPPWMAWVRLFLVLTCTIFFVVMAVTAVVAQMKYDGKNNRKWYPEDGGWQEHVASTASEWIVACSFCAYILTFAHDFKEISMHEPQIVMLKETLTPNNSEEAGSPEEPSLPPPPYSPYQPDYIPQPSVNT